MDLRVHHPPNYAQTPATGICDRMEQQIVLHAPDCTQMLVTEICDGMEQLIVPHPPGSA